MSKKLPAEVCVMDMTTLRVAVSTDTPRVLQVLTPANEVLWQGSLDELATRLGPDAATRQGAIVLDAFDSVLAHATVLREVASGELRLHSIGLLNPFTNEIAVRALPKTVAFAAPAALTNPGPHGALALLEGNELVVDELRVVPREMERRDLTTAAAAHAV
jgi:hypothetical protein